MPRPGYCSRIDRRFLRIQRLSGNAGCTRNVDKRERSQRMAHRFPQLGADPRNRLISGAGDTVHQPDDRAEKSAAWPPVLALLAGHDCSPGLCPCSGFYVRPAGCRCTWHPD